jgi:hypothetical protein
MRRQLAHALVRRRLEIVFSLAESNDIAGERGVGE